MPSPITLFVLAHPDDECMFFTPTVHGMRKKSELHILVLSNGGYDGLGKIRTKEMEVAAKEMGFTESTVIDDPRIPDGPHPWDLTVVQELISSHLDGMKSRGKQVGTIVTFDDYGVSGHPNHISVSQGCKKLYEKGSKHSFDLYTLESVPIYRKFIAFFDIFLSDTRQQSYSLRSPFPAMRIMACHHSQWVWFRKLFTCFTRYVYYNGLDYHPKK